MTGMTLLEKYYAINKAIMAWMQGQSVYCPIVKYGIDPAVLKATFADQSLSLYPYFQTFISNVRPVAWTTKEAGILTEFDFQLSFFTSPEDETVNDSSKFTPFEMARIAFTDISLRVLEEIDDDTGESLPYASILSTNFHYEFEMKSGSPVPSAFMLARMRAVCSYPTNVIISDPGLSTDIFDGIEFTNKE